MRGYLEKEWDHFLESFKFKKKHSLIILYDLIFAIIFGLVSFFYGKTIIKIYISKVMSFDFNAVFQGYGVYSAYYSLLKFYIYFIILTLLAYLFVIFVYSFFRMVSWNNLFEKQHSHKTVLKYFFYNLIIFPLNLSLIIFSIVKFGTTGVWVAILFAFLFFHFNTYFIIHYVKHKSVFKSIKLSFTEGMKVHKFFIGYLFVFLLLFLFIYIFSSFSTIEYTLLPVVILLLYFWLRNYLRVKHA